MQSGAQMQKWRTDAKWRTKSRSENQLHAPKFDNSKHHDPR
jgi:hypothetical protein